MLCSVLDALILHRLIDWFDLWLKIQFGSVNKLGTLDNSFIKTRFALLPCQSICLQARLTSIAVYSKSN